MTSGTAGNDDLLERVLAGDHRALARTISRIEDRAPGYRELVAGLYDHAGTADVIGITGSPGAGKSTLVDKLAETYREQGKTVGIVAIDPASPFTGGSVLGDRIRMASTVGDMDVFVRSMSARGALGGLSAATTEAVTAMDAFGKDVVIVETVGAGQNEIDVVKAADTVAVLVPPGSGDSVQTLKAGILEIADVFVVNKADREGSDRTVRELREMIELGEDGPDASPDAGDLEERGGWSPPIVETVATEGEGVADLMVAFDDHQRHLAESGDGARQARRRHAEQIRTLLREDVHGLLEEELAARGGVEELAEAVRRGERDPYAVVEELLEPLERRLAEREAGSPEPPR
ncbi:methylmalonyl Co-A mutase-associated GTPase MeaB [Saliphagus infecundisoli]|uniref:Methylmalonyl Co-A mutase-associated GTPase MeaB n=1 Tax=Saliphagus infecundisoli TaxID=1849069 RepID=A0ABD5Q9N7_9EURY|nr:methylmalonyl Co-A mutase-associated GTPase MeaB [Saliphagus infecundisoli]